MRKFVLALCAAASTVALPIVAHAQGVGISGLLSADQRLRFREYVISQSHPSTERYKIPVIVSVILPASVALYPIPAGFGVSETYRYAIVNDRMVLVEPRTRIVVQVID